MNHRILDDITFFFDKIRIAFGDSKCPLCQKCSQQEDDNDCCVTFRGRIEIGGDRTPCYFSNKMRIRDSEKKKKIGILSKILRPIVSLILSIGGERENDNIE